MDQLSIQWGPPADLWVGRGPLDAERRLLSQLDELLPSSESNGPIRPVLLLVPSKSLRLHLLGRIVQHRRAAVLGLECRTHHALALTLLERAGCPSPRGPDLFPLFARRLAGREGPLRGSLDHLRDGYSAVLAPVADLLDAGIDPAHVEALEDALTSETVPTSRRGTERALSLVRVAAGTVHELRRHGLSRTSILLQRAAEVLATRRGEIDHLLPYRHVIVYGFNDATGVTTDFLLGTLGARGGSFYLENPPDPADRTGPDPGLSFSRSFRERIETAIPSAEEESGGPGTEKQQAPPPAIDFFRALGAQAEVREVAQRIRELLERQKESGIAGPERIGVVARQLEPYVAAIRTQFDRLCIPFSGLAPIGPFDPSFGRLHALLQLLRERARTPVERWIDTAALARIPAELQDLLVGFRVLGAARLQDAAELRIDAIVERGGLRLPVRTGLEGQPVEGESPDTERADRRSRATPRWLDAGLLSQAVEAARATREHFDTWPGRAPASEHAEQLSHLLRDILAWPDRQPEDRALLAELERALGVLPADLELDAEEVFLFLRLELQKTGQTALGGRGGGVQVLDVIEARSRTFDHLFLLGLNRGSFPRSVEEDPLLPDPLRHVLGRSGFGVLPDLPVKKKGFHEERYLFAQLLSSSPRVTISWQEVDEQQNLRAVSPLVERLRLSGEFREGDQPEIPTARPVFSPSDEELGRPRPAYEVAVLAGIGVGHGRPGERGIYGPALETALGAAAAGAAGAAGREAVEARLRILDELDPPLSGGAGAAPSPYFGFVGELPAERALYVTALEGLARCPWRHFLQRMLWIEPLPDPLETVPGIEALYVGQVVHDVLEQIVRTGLAGAPQSWDEALDSPGQILSWPEPSELESLVLRKARAVVLQRNLGLPGLDRALARATSPHLQVARREDWPAGTSRAPIVAAEIEGRLPLPHPGSVPREILFRADRMDRSRGEGNDGFTFTDYKTGRWSPGKGSSASAGRRLLNAVREGEWLQAAAYALAARTGDDRGRYLFLNPLFDDDAGRVFSVSAGQERLIDHFARAVSALVSVWDAGALFPRLLNWRGDKEPAFCSFCDVSDACIRGDSGARRRLRAWVQDQAAPESDTSPEGAAAVAAWYLERPEPRRSARRSGGKSR